MTLTSEKLPLEQRNTDGNNVSVDDVRRRYFSAGTVNDVYDSAAAGKTVQTCSQL